MSWARSALGLAVLAGIAVTYPGFTKPARELVSTAGNTPADVVIASKLADTWFTSILYGLLIALLCIVVFAVLMVVLTRPGKRLLMLRYLCKPLIAFVLFAGLMAILVGAIDLFAWVFFPVYQRFSDGSGGARAVGPVGAGNSVTAVDLVSCAWSGTGKFGIRLHGSHAVRHFRCS